MTYALWEGEGSAGEPPAETVFFVGTSWAIKAPRCLKHMADFIGGKLKADDWNGRNRPYVAPLPVTDHGVEVLPGDVNCLGEESIMGTEILHSAQLAGFMSAVWASFRWNRYTYVCQYGDQPPEQPTMGTVCKGGGPSYKLTWHSAVVPVLFGRSDDVPFWAEVLAKYAKLVRLMSLLPWPAGTPLQEWLKDPRSFPLVGIQVHGPGITGPGVATWSDTPTCPDLMKDLHWK